LRSTLRDRLERALEALWEGRAPLAWALLFLPLGLLSLLTRWGGARRRRKPRRRASVTVVSVGNLRVGGTGKTQVVLELCRRAEALGLSPAVVLRGYGGNERGPVRVTAASDPARSGDEALLLSRRCPGTLVVVARDRWEGVELARSEGRRWVALDDGLQQRYVEPQRSVVVMPADAPLGNGWLLPLGPLREPIGRLIAADLVWLHGDGLGLGVQPAVRSRSKLVGAVSVQDLAAALKSIKGQRIAAFSGIARPHRFRQTLADAGAEIAVDWRLSDHRVFSVDELRLTAQEAQRAGATALVCTEKDAVRLPPGLQLPLPLLALRLELEILAGEARLAELLKLD
jgi:tetraacyldisaccharide 4'-kinase